MAKKKTTSKKSTATRTVSKTKAIQDYLASQPAAKPAEVAAELKKQGVDVSPNYVSNIKSLKINKKKPTTKKKATTRKRHVTAKKRPAAKPQREATPVDDVREAGSLMYQALDLVLKAGVKEARSMVEMADKMINRISNNENKK